MRVIYNITMFSRMFLILLALFSMTLFSAPRKIPLDKKAFQITRCLGAEEALIYQAQEKGPVYHVNQLLLSIFLNLSKINLKEQYYQPLCRKPEIGTSLKLLELIFRKYNQLFTKTNTQEQATASLEDISELINKLPELFNQYLLALKLKSPTHNCLENNIKELSEFYIQVQYLEQETNFKVIADKDNQLVKILNQLKNREEFFQKCLKDLNNTSQNI